MELAVGKKSRGVHSQT